MCSMQDLGRYLEGQGQSMTLQQTYPAHYFVIWSRILQLFDRNDNYIEMMCHYLAHCFGSVRTILHYTKKSCLIASFSGLQKKECVHFVHRNYSFLSESWIINDIKQELMINKELFEGPVGDYCIARNTVKCLLFKYSA